MIWFTLLIPIFTIIFLLMFFRDKVQYWEYAVVLIPSVLMILLLNYVMVQSRISDTEYIGYDVVSVKHYERWNEWIHKTCSVTHCSGSGKNRSCYTTYYDCSYCKNHPEYWVMVTSKGHELEISEEYYTYLIHKFSTRTYFVDMDRHYYTINGDMYQTDWSKTIQTAHSVTFTQSYENRIKASHSVFKLEDIKPEDAKKMKLNDYPDVNEYYQDCILNYKQSEIEERKIHYLNGYIGNKVQARTFIVIFKNQPQSIAYKHRSNWEGGNKNEFIICIGVDSLTNRINWVKSFSWMDVPILAVDIDSYISSQQKLDVNNILDYLIKKEPNEWHRKNFHDFDYLKIEVTSTQLYWIIFIVMIMNIGISIWVILNEFK